jgi:hypothetical protein
VFALNPFINAAQEHVLETIQQVCLSDVNKFPRLSPLMLLEIFYHAYCRIDPKELIAASNRVSKTLGYEVEGRCL